MDFHPEDPGHQHNFSSRIFNVPKTPGVYSDRTYYDCYQTQKTTVDLVAAEYKVKWRGNGKIARWTAPAVDPKTGAPILDENGVQLIRMVIALNPPENYIRLREAADKAEIDAAARGAAHANGGLASATVPAGGRGRRASAPPTPSAALALPLNYQIGDLEGEPADDHLDVTLGEVKSEKQEKSTGKQGRPTRGPLAKPGEAAGSSAEKSNSGRPAAPPPPVTETMDLDAALAAAASAESGVQGGSSAAETGGETSGAENVGDQSTNASVVSEFGAPPGVEIPVQRENETQQEFVDRVFDEGYGLKPGEFAATFEHVVQSEELDRSHAEEEDKAAERTLMPTEEPETEKPESLSEMLGSTDETGSGDHESATFKRKSKRG
jgi:hypothetical protein